MKLSHCMRSSAPFARMKTMERLQKILSLYRVTLGQARQEELLEYLFNNCDVDEIKKLFINLSPYSKEKPATTLE